MSSNLRPKLPFTRLGEYEVLAPISEGGMATVWLGRSTQPAAQLVALKVVRPEHVRNKDFLAMFLDEARIASRLSHPNIIAIHGLGHDGKRHFLAMEVLRGHTLLDTWRAAHARGGRLPYEMVAWIGARVADALHYAHEQVDDHGAAHQVVHRDVNPSNIFLTQEGVPKLIDFGLAKARDRIASTAIGVVKGKLAYLAPEQAHGHAADRRADVFALGVTLWEISLDRRLFREDSDVATIRRVREAQVPDPTTLIDDYPRVLADVITRALARDPKDRWQTAGELRDALDAFVHGTGTAIGQESVCALLAELFGSDTSAAWERLVDEAAVGPERIRVWDDEQQKLTWMNASIESAESAAGVPAVAGSVEPAAATQRERLGRALDERLSKLDARTDVVAVARVHLERAIVEEVLGDSADAIRHAEASLAAASTGPAHEMLRRLQHARGTERVLIAHLDAEIAECTFEPARADLLAERARLLEAAHEPVESVRAAWERALAVSPHHPAALKGLEATLTGDTGAREALASHLGRLAEAYAADPRLAAWLQVDRSRLLDRGLAQRDSAKAALLRALDLDAGIGPVRAACVAHAVVHHDASWLVELLADEAALEKDPGRAARLELEAACVARHRLGDSQRAVALLEFAVRRDPIAPSVHRRALDDLVVMHEAAGRASDALRVRGIRLGLVHDPRARAHEHRAIAALEESLGNRGAAIAALERTLELEGDDVTVADELDRLLEAESLPERRIELWARQAAAAGDGRERARRLVRAARLAESIGAGERAMGHLRAALASQPSNDEAADRLLRLLAPPTTEAASAQAWARVAVHAHAAEHAVDAARRIAHLEAIALIQEETLGDPSLATGTYDAILRLEPGRRGAVLGLARTAARTGDGAALARALLEEAGATADPGTADALRVRAAEALAPSDAERALAIVRDVLTHSPAHAEARQLEQRLHEAAGRWAQVDVALAARIEHASDDRVRVDLWLARAKMQRTRLRAAPEALASLRAALAIDPRHPAAREALAAQLEAAGDARAFRDGLVELASSQATAEERARTLSRAAEIDEIVLLDDTRAEELYARALGEAPGDAWIEDSRVRVLRRRAREGHAAELYAALSARLDAALPNATYAFDLALALLDGGGDIARATSIVDAMLAEDPSTPHALRTLERIARATGAAPLLANALAQQAEVFTAEVPKLGALWAEAALVEWTLPGGDTATIVDRILKHAPADRAALDAAARLALQSVRAGDGSARIHALSALRARLGQATGDTERLCLRLTIALASELEGQPRDDDALGALANYREALRIDAHSVVAAEGTARLGAAVGDGEATVAAALAHADLASEHRRRAVFLVQAAGQILSVQDPRLGARPDRLARAGEILERALDADPESLPAVSLLAAVRGEDGLRDRLLGALRGAFERARSSEVIVGLGAEVARVASLEPPDRVLAIDALRRVLAAVPGHVLTLRALADQCIAQGAWADAVQALEALAAQGRDPRAKLGALFELGELYAHTLGKPAEVERVLRVALDVDPTNVEALRRLIAHQRSTGAGADAMDTLLTRLGEAESTPEEKATALCELADLRLAAGDAAATEGALIEATAQAPTAARIARVVELHAKAPVEQARALAAIVVRAEELERPDATCLAELGQLEVTLGRWPEGVAHLRVALGLAPANHEARAALAEGLMHARAAAEATALLAPMIVPDATPLLSLRNPARALATLESALAAEGRRDEALVARELRAIAGGLDDGAHAELRARRIRLDPAAPVPIALDPATLRANVVPPDVPPLLLDVAAAIAGAESKLARGSLEELGVTARDRLSPAGGQPLLGLVYRLAAMLGVARPEIAVSGRIEHARVVVHEAPWLVVPESLLAQAEPVQAAAICGPLVRIALALAWLDDLPSPFAHAVLCGAARQVVPGYASDITERDQQELIEEFTRTVARAVGRRQKKLLAGLAPALAARRAPTLADIEAFERGIARTELRAAFVMTGDLLATLDAARILDQDLARATANVGAAALRATLVHPTAGDAARFALASSTTALRWRAGTRWA